MRSRAERAAPLAEPVDHAVGVRDGAGAGGDIPAGVPAAASRVAAEWALHVLAAALLLWGLRQSARAASPVGTEAADAGTLRTALVRWSTVAAPASVHVAFDSLPTAAEREWLAALPGAGTPVSWHAGAVVPIGLTASAVADPAGLTRLRVAAPPGTALVLRDAVGVLDTVTVRPGGAGDGATVTVPASFSPVVATGGGTRARAVAGDSLVLKRVLVMGRVGWESRFIIDALEERGWRVDVRLALAPHNPVVQGAAGVIDTARYAAVVVADSSAARDAGRLAAYVRSGGGLVLAGTAAAMPGIRAVAPGRPGSSIPAGTMGSGDSVSTVARSHLGLVPIVDLASDAVPLDVRESVVAVAARRIGVGRVLQSGYVDTWRWRMGAARGVAGHRAWWAGLVSDVAYAPAVRRVSDRTADNAPVARLIDALGPMRAVSRTPGPPADATRRGWLFGAIVFALVAEWGSRRLRGAR